MEEKKSKRGCGGRCWEGDSGQSPGTGDASETKSGGQDLRATLDNLYGSGGVRPHTVSAVTLVRDGAGFRQTQETTAIQLSRLCENTAKIGPSRDTCKYYL